MKIKRMSLLLFTFILLFSFSNSLACKYFQYPNNKIVITNINKYDKITIQANPNKTIKKIKCYPEDMYTYVQYSDNKIELYYCYYGDIDYLDEHIRKIQANKSKIIEHFQVTPNLGSLISYSDNTIDILDHCYKFRSSIQADISKKIKSIALLSKGIIKINYTDSTIGLFSVKNKRKINTYKKIMRIVGGSVLVYSNNEIDLVHAETGEKLDILIQANPQKEISYVRFIGESIIRVTYSDSELNFDFFNINNRKKVNKDKKMQCFVTTVRGSTLFIVYDDNMIDLIDINSGNAISEIQVDQDKVICSVLLEDNDTKLKVKYNCNLKNRPELFDIYTRQKINTNKQHQNGRKLFIKNKKIIEKFENNKFNIYAKKGEQINKKIIEASPNLLVSKVSFLDDSIFCVTYSHKKVLNQSNTYKKISEKIELFNMESGKKIENF